MKVPENYALKTTAKLLAAPFDPADVLQTVADQEVLLFESADVVTKLGEKSMLFLDLALRVEARDGLVVVQALLEEARPLLHLLKEALPHNIKDTGDLSVTFLFEPLYHHLDLLQKMHSSSALDVLRNIMSAIMPPDLSVRQHAMLAGTFSYDFLDHFERLPDAKKDIHNFPDYLFYVPFTVVLLEHKNNIAQMVVHGYDDAHIKTRLKKTESLIEQGLHLGQAKDKNMPHKEALFQPDITDEDFGQLVSRCKEFIAAGDVYQIVPSRTFSCKLVNPLLGYRALRTLNPSPYMFFVRTREWTLLGASPETFIKVDQNGQRLSIRPIAGTRRRGFGESGIIDEELDSRQQASLCLDEKELAEHMMLVDLARNDIASVCQPKSRRINRMLVVDRFSHVMHLVSEVEGQMLPNCDALLAYQASMNMGTLMGAPKVRAAELLRENEATKRGFYGGAVGYLDALGNMDTAIIIRSALVQGHTAHVRAGCGVVSDSNIQFEVQETLNKAEATLRALCMADAV